MTDGSEVPSPPPPPRAPKRQNALDRLAQRSTGLPQDVGKSSPSPEPSRFRLAGMGLQMAVTVGLAAALGRWLDARLGWQYGATLTLAMLTLVGNLYLLIREAMKIDK